MTAHDDDRPDDGVDSSAPARRPRFGRKQAVGVVGLAALLGVGSYLLTAQLTGHDAPSDVGAVGPVVVQSETDTPEMSVAPSEASPTSTASTTKTSAKTAPTTTATAAAAAAAAGKDPAKVKQEIQAAREAAAKDGVKVQRGLTAKDGPIDGLATRTENTAQGIIRITTAKGDLTGRQDQLMAGDAGRPVGKAHCTNKLRLSTADPRQIPTVLLCWRTSADRSVVTLAVSRKGAPSADQSADVIGREWARLG